jgi:hypothetical protein
MIPRVIEGKCLKDRFDEWHRQNPNQVTTGVLSSNASTAGQTMMYGISSSSTQPTDTSSSFHFEAENRIAVLEREVFALRSGRLFKENEHVRPPRILKRGEPFTPKVTIEEVDDIDKTTPPPSTTSPEKSTPSTETSNETNKPTSTTSTSSTDEPTEAPIHPYRDVSEPNYAPPRDRNFAASPPKPPKEKEVAYRTQAPIYDQKLAEEVYSRTMKTPFVTLSQQELLSLSPEVRQKIRDDVTPKRVLSDSAPKQVSTTIYIEDPLPFVDETPQIISNNSQQPPHGAYIAEDPYEVYLNTLGPTDTDTYFVAKESHALRSIMMLVDNSGSVESIVDPGSQIVAMSQAVCHEFAIVYDPAIRLNMQSANGEIDKSLGLARNVPCRIRDITIYLQIHVIKSPAYDILLGRPFDVLTESVVKNYRNEDQTITICDPNTGKRATIPTIPRGQPRYIVDEPIKPDKDFQESKMTTTAR